MKNDLSHWRLAVRVLSFVILHSSFVIFSSCSRGPQTARELFDRLPRRYSGELHLQGETGTRTLGVELLDLKVRDEHHLEFGRVAYQVTSNDEGMQRGEAPVRGTISAPGGEVRIEDADGAGGGDALKPGSFEGKLAADLESVEARWKTGFDQAVNYRAKSAR